MLLLLLVILDEWPVPLLPCSGPGSDRACLGMSGRLAEPSTAPAPGILRRCRISRRPLEGGDGIYGFIFPRCHAEAS